MGAPTEPGDPKSADNAADDTQDTAAARAARAAEITRPSVWKTIVAALALFLCLVDDEWIWIPALIYGICFYVYKQILRACRAVASIPPTCVLSGIVAGAASNLFVSWVPLPASAVRLRAARLAYLSSPSALISPLAWGLRLGIFTAVLRRFMLATEPDEATTQWRAACGAFAGGWAEFWSRVVTAPLSRITDAKQTWGKGMSARDVARDMFKRRGFLPFWEGMPPLYVEIPHAAAQLGLFSLMRDQATTRLGLTWDAESTWKDRATIRAPVDALCGATAALVSHSMVHGFRSRAEEMREFSFHSTVGNSTYVRRPCAPLPMTSMLGVRVPQAAVMYAIYGSVMSAIDPSRPENGFRGWGEAPPAVSQYGARMHRGRAEDDTFWGFFGALYPHGPDYERRAVHRRRSDEIK
eukprot:Hpha_TRINITY_DN17364_c0_g1::TRINITY_DN17364_c0_g1_i1::g.138056::m.138056